MKVLIAGDGGQLAYELKRNPPADVNIVAFNAQQMDITQRDIVNHCVQEVSPDVVINAAAYTAVDKAESESALAFAVNRDGAANLASACQSVNAFYLHISTDFIFDGMKSSPYLEQDQAAPLSVYGDSKWQGEQAVMDSSLSAWAIIRTAWVYSSHGQNFVKSMLRLMSEKPQLGIVADQIGTPTWAKGLADICWQVIDQRLTGVYHWTDAGVASWYDFAVAIQALAIQKGLLTASIPVNPIKTADYPTAARRPSYSVMDKSKILASTGQDAVHWQRQLSTMLDDLQNSGNL